MNYVSYCATLIFLASNFITCMEPAKSGQIVTFLDQQSQQPITTIPFELAMYCQTIKNAVGDFPSTDDLSWVVPGASAEDLFNFTPCLRAVHTMSNCPASDEKGLNSLKRLLSNRICILNNDELVNVACIADYLEVKHKYFNSVVVQTLAERILAKKPGDRQCFNGLNSAPILIEVMKELSKNINLEKAFIQPYSDALTERHSLPRTEPILTSLYCNLRNVLTAPLRAFSSRPCFEKTMTQPYYVNNKTGTVITGLGQEKNESVLNPVYNSYYTKTSMTLTHLCINKKNSDQDIIIPLEGVRKITSIEANAIESLFICRVYKSNDSQLSCIVINNEGKIISENFAACAFLDNDDELCVIKNGNCGIFTIRTDDFKEICFAGENEFLGITTTINNDRAIVASYTMDKVFIGEKLKGCQLVFTKPLDVPNAETCFQEGRSVAKVYNICLHPHGDKIYLKRCDDYGSACSNLDLFCIDLKTFKATKLSVDIGALSSGMDKVDYFQFISDDILFCGGNKQDDFFINTKTNNFWTKKKNPKTGYEQIFSGIKGDDDFYDRIALTPDGKHSIERTVENYPLMDLIFTCIRASSNSSSKDATKSLFKTKKITAAPLIDDNVIEVVKRINNGLLPLEMLHIAQAHQAAGFNAPDKEQLKKLTEGMKKVVGAAHTQWKSYLINGLFGLGFCAAVLSPLIINDKDRVYDMVEAGTLKGMAFGAALLYFLTKNLTSQY